MSAGSLDQQDLVAYLASLQMTSVFASAARQYWLPYLVAVAAFGFKKEDEIRRGLNNLALMLWAFLASWGTMDFMSTAPQGLWLMEFCLVSTVSVWPLGVLVVLGWRSSRWEFQGGQSAALLFALLVLLDWIFLMVVIVTMPAIPV